MATLEKIRSKAGLLVLVVGLALFAFIIGDFLNSGSTYFRQSQERIAEIDGEVVKIQDIKVALMRWPRCIRCNPVQPACPRNI